MIRITHLGFMLLAMSFSWLSHAQNVHGVLRVVKGDVQIKSAQSGETVKGRLGEKVYPKDVIITGKDARAKIVMIDKNEINVSPESQVEIQNYEFSGDSAKKDVLLNVIYGKVRSKVEQKYDGKTSKFQIKTKSAIAGVRGTDFLMGFNRATSQSQVVTFEGKVEFGVPGPNGTIANPVVVEPGKQASVGAGQAAPTPPREMPKEELNKMEQESKSEPPRGNEGPREQQSAGGEGEKAEGDQAKAEAEGDKSKGEGDKGSKREGDKAQGEGDKGEGPQRDGDKAQGDGDKGQPRENNNARAEGPRSGDGESGGSGSGGASGSANASPSAAASGERSADNATGSAPAAEGGGRGPASVGSPSSGGGSAPPPVQTPNPSSMIRSEDLASQPISTPVITPNLPSTTVPITPVTNPGQNICDVCTRLIEGGNTKLIIRVQ